MASRPSRLLLLALWTSTTTALSTDVTKFLPSCVADCIESFVAVNYDASQCGSSPSLECLCRYTGSSGFTIGEGGVQCLITETNRRACQGSESSSDVVSRVYSMCAGVKNAAPQTHSTIVATLVIPAGTGPVQLPGSSPTVAPTAVTSATISITAIPTVSPTSTATSRPSASAAPVAGGSPQLSPVQIAGISIGIAATVFFAIGLIFLAKCIRRRRYGDQEAGFYKPKRGTKGFGMLKSNQSSPQVLQISAPIHKTPVEMEFKRPGDVRLQQQRLGQQAVGLAISPPTGVHPSTTPTKSPLSAGVIQPPKTYLPYRPNERNSPIQTSPQVIVTKPTLTLSIPHQPAPPPKQQQRQMLSARTRDSVMTEFQEDGEADSMGGGSNIWRPPPTDPQSTTTYYVPVNGNWVLRTKSSQQSQNSDPAELPSPVNKTKAEKAMETLPDSPTAATATGWVPQIPKHYLGKQGLPASPSPTRKPSPAKLGSPFRLNTQTVAPRQASSVYSNFSLPQISVPGPSNPLPPVPTSSSATMRENGPGGFRPYLSKTQQQQQQQSQPQSRPKSKRFSKHHQKVASQDSSTTISSSIAGPFDQEESLIDELRESLSPVAESPKTPLTPGKSPVSYPQIPIPGPAQGMVERKRADILPVQASDPKPLRAVNHEHQAAFSLFPRDNLMSIPVGLGVHAQSSPVIGEAKVSPLRTRNQNQAGLPPNPRQQQQPPSRPTHLHPASNPSAIKTGSPELRTGSVPLEKQHRPNPHPHPHPSHRRQSSLQSSLHSFSGGIPIHLTDATPTSASTGASSSWLATKRLGADRAAALALGDEVGKRRKWAKDNDGHGGGGDGQGKELPATPGWKPKLTPTRRGDDLFLSVQ